MKAGSMIYNKKTKEYWNNTSLNQKTVFKY